MNEAIDERQNSTWALNRLAAQRYLYQKAKRTDSWRFMLIVLIVVLTLVGLWLQISEFSQGVTVLVVSVWVIDQCLSTRIASIKREAATVQADFDCQVLCIPWSYLLGIERPTESRVNQLAKKAEQIGLEQSGLKNWYLSQHIPADKLEAQLHCQRKNCHWDSEQRRSWLVTCRRIVYTSIVLFVLFGILLDATLLDGILIVAAGLRLIAWLYTEWQSHQIAATRTKRLTKALSALDTNNTQSIECQIAVAQYAIFEHRRSCPTVPDWFYKLKRNTYERELAT